MIIFDLPREKHAKTTLFVNIETEIADFENRRGKRAVSTQKEPFVYRPISGRWPITQKQTMDSRTVLFKENSRAYLCAYTYAGRFLMFITVFTVLQSTRNQIIITIIILCSRCIKNTSAALSMRKHGIFDAKARRFQRERTVLSSSAGLKDRK
jgi:hypothetical protein